MRLAPRMLVRVGVVALAVVSLGAVLVARTSGAGSDTIRVALTEQARVVELRGDDLEVTGFAGCAQCVKIVARAIEEPMRWIATNAGQEGSIVVQKVREMKGDEGFNALTDTYENLVQAGVIDPAKVVRSALQNASSIASLLLTTEALVCEIPEKTAAPTPGGGGMAGMY